MTAREKNRSCKPQNQDTKFKSLPGSSGKDEDNEKEEIKKDSAKSV